MKRLITLYLVVALFTFGHAYHASDAYLVSRHGKSSVGENLVRAVFSAPLWPLYWSVRLQMGGDK